MNNNYVIISAIMGALGVGLGAFGAHGLKNILSPELLETYKTGIFYHLIHTVVLLMISLNTKYYLKLPFIFFLAGIIFFSFSLCLYSVTQIKFLVFLTPIGGILLILGWFSIIVSVVQGNSKK